MAGNDPNDPVAQAPLTQKETDDDAILEVKSSTGGWVAAADLHLSQRPGGDTAVLTSFAIDPIRGDL